MTEDIDRIYDEHVRAERLKNGTKYERLAAFVMQVLDANAVVVHDVNERGDGKQTLHQLDVRVEHKGRERRLIVECRDFETGVVTQAQALKFAATLRQLEADGLIVTTTRFTKGAKDVASDEGFALAELRPTTDEDMKGRIRSIHFTLNMIYEAREPRINFVLADLTNAEKKQLVEALGCPEFGGVMSPRDVVVTHRDGATNTLKDDVDKALSGLPLEAGSFTGEFRYDEAVTVDVGGVPVPMIGFDWDHEQGAAPHEFTVNDDDRIPLLILRTLDGEVNRIFSDRDLERWSLDEQGKVVERGG